MLRGTKFKLVCQLYRKKATVLAARALKTKAHKKSNPNEYKKALPQQTGAKTDERATEKVVHNVKQRLTATVATQTESPRAAPTKTLEAEVQVNLERKKKVSVATQTVQLDDGCVSEPEIEQPMNEQPSVNNILARLCALTEECLKPKSLGTLVCANGGMS